MLSVPRIRHTMMTYIDNLRFSISLCSSYQIGAVVNSTALWIMPPPLNGLLKGPIFVKIWSPLPWLLNLQVSCKSSFHLFSWRRPSLWRGRALSPLASEKSPESQSAAGAYFSPWRGVYFSPLRYTTSIYGEICIVVYLRQSYAGWFMN